LVFVAKKEVKVVQDLLCSLPLRNLFLTLQGRSQTVTGVTVVTGPRAQGGLWGAQEGAPRSPKKGPGKEAAQKRAVKAKERKGKKRKKMIKSKGVMAALRDPGGP
jgi:hypothetical protein